MEINKETIEVMKAWGEIYQKRLRRQIFALGVNDTKSLVSSAKVSEPVSNQINLSYNYYGMFADMGVGKGVSLSRVKSSGRKAKKWYSKTTWKEVAKLSEILVREHGINLQAGVLSETSGFNKNRITLNA